MSNDEITRSTKRPKHLDAPDYLRKNSDIPKPENIEKEQIERLNKGPTRYGDWEKNGIAVDF